MKTDSLFYRIFHTLPEIFFALTGFEYCPSDYLFQAVEIKQTAFRLDGVFKPVVENPNLPTIFVEVQFQPDDRFYSRFFSEIFLYLHQYPQTNPCKAVVIYPERKTEIDTLQCYADLINIANINRIYLQESVGLADSNWQLKLLELIITDVKAAPMLAKQLITTLTVQGQNESPLLDLIETIITYKFPHLKRDEVRKMLHIPDIHLDIRKTQFYQDVYAEGEIKGEIRGELQGEIKVILNLLNRRFGEINTNLVEQIKSLNLNQVDYLAESLLDFKQLDELVRWLKQFNRLGDKIN
jgi:predicted transposase/invertase (TIGR01784 family)